jgi:hypothetical protein
MFHSCYVVYEIQRDAFPLKKMGGAGLRKRPKEAKKLRL